MDLLLELAEKYGFKRVCSKLDRPIVFHCVPGAGKSSLIRELLAGDRRIGAYTAGIPDEAQLSGSWIKSCAEHEASGEFCVLDEYTLYGGDLNKFFAVFGDPCQNAKCEVLRAHFTATFSRRFGKATAQLLRELGFNVEASGEDIVQILDIYKADTRGVVLYIEEEVGCLLRRHCIEAFTPEEVVGQTFDEVTFVTGENHVLIGRKNETFQCLTRHRRVLTILNPYASYTAT